MIGNFLKRHNYGQLLLFGLNNYVFSDKFKRKLLRLVSLYGIELPEISYLSSKNQESNQ